MDSFISDHVGDSGEPEAVCLSCFSPLECGDLCVHCVQESPSLRMASLAEEDEQETFRFYRLPDGANQ